MDALNSAEIEEVKGAITNILRNDNLLDKQINELKEITIPIRTEQDVISFTELIISLVLHNSSDAYTLSFLYFDAVYNLNNSRYSYHRVQIDPLLNLNKYFDNCVAHEEMLSSIQSCTTKERKQILVADYYKNHSKNRGKLINISMFISEVFKRKQYTNSSQLLQLCKRLLRLKGEMALRCLCILLTTSNPVFSSSSSIIIPDMEIITENEVTSDSLRKMMSIVFSMVENGWNEDDLKNNGVLEETDYETYRIEKILNDEFPQTENSDVIQTEEDMKDEDLFHQVRYVLNNLTPENFVTLSGQFKKFPISTLHQLQGVIDLLFDIAAQTPNSLVGYALLCRVLTIIQVPLNNESKEVVGFRELLASKCLKLLQNEQYSVQLQEIESCTDPDKKKELMFNLDCDIRRMKKKLIEKVRFVGELFNQQLLTVNIIMQFLHKLLDTADEEKPEWFCALINKICNKFKSRKVNVEKILSKIGCIRADRSSCKYSNHIYDMLRTAGLMLDGQTKPIIEEECIWFKADIEQLIIQDLEIKSLNTVESLDSGLLAKMQEEINYLKELNKTIQNGNKLEQTAGCHCVPLIEVNHLKQTNKEEQRDDFNNSMLVEINSLKETMNELNKTLQKGNEFVPIESLNNSTLIEINHLKETVNELSKPLQNQQKVEQIETLNATLIEMKYLKEMNQQKDELIKSLRRENKLLAVLGNLNDEI